MSKFFSIIHAVSQDRLFSEYEKLPWLIWAEYNYFRNITTKPYNKFLNVVIMGRKTWETTPKLKDRIEIVVSSSIIEDKDRDVKVVKSLEEALDYTQTIEHGKIFVIGGTRLIEEAFTNLFCEEIYESIIWLSKKDSYDTGIDKQQKFLKKVPENFFIHKKTTEKLYDSKSDMFLNVDFIVFRSVYTPENAYINLLNNILSNGEKRDDRTGTGTISIFGEHLEIDILDKFPLLTTKKLNFKHILTENIWFISGAKNIEYLQSNGVKIWNGNTSREFLDKRGLFDYNQGDTGPLYGFQWRNFGGVDQLNRMLNLLKTDPMSRRIFMSCWNPPELDKMCLEPCHISFQLYVSADLKYLDGHLYMRSSDVFLGLPWNIAGYSLLLYMFGCLSGYTPRKLYLSFGDTHIYLNHIQQVKLQIERPVRNFPTLKIKEGRYTTFEDFNLDSFDLENYHPHPYIPAIMAV
jgi:thymidylate synthase